MNDEVKRMYGKAAEEAYIEFLDYVFARHPDAHKYFMQYLECRHPSLLAMRKHEAVALDPELSRLLERCIEAAELYKQVSEGDWE